VRDCHGAASVGCVGCVYLAILSFRHLEDVFSYRLFSHFNPLFRAGGSLFLHSKASDGDSGRADRLLPFLPAIRRFMKRRVPAVDVDDLTQEVFARMLNHANVEGIDNIEGYLFRVAANVIAAKGRSDRVRHASAHDEFTDEDLLVEDNSPESILLHRNLLQSMVRLIHALPPRTQQAFVLHRFEEMTYDAIARHMEISVSAVEKHIMRAISHLTAQMKGLNK